MALATQHKQQSEDEDENDYEEDSQSTLWVNPQVGRRDSPTLTEDGRNLRCWR